jgi:hypothetical protein
MAGERRGRSIEADQEISQLLEETAKGPRAKPKTCIPAMMN